MPKTKAILIDITKCIGCRSCMAACKQLHGFPQESEAKLSPGFALTLATVTAAAVAFHYALVYLENAPRSVPAKHWMTAQPATAL